MKLKVRKMTGSDIWWVWERRNADRDQFFDNRKIPYYDQLKWWDRVSQDSKQEWWIIEDEDAKKIAGSFSLLPCSMDLPIFGVGKPVRYWGTLLVAPDYRGQGVLREGLKVLNPKYSYIGYHKESNIASLRATLKLGFVCKGLFATEQGPMWITFKE